MSSSLLEEEHIASPPHHQHLPIQEKFPIQTRQIAVNINNHPTDIIITTFSDYIFFVISQTEKLGSLVFSLFFTKNLLNFAKFLLKFY